MGRVFVWQIADTAQQRHAHSLWYCCDYMRVCAYVLECVLFLFIRLSPLSEVRSYVVVM